MPCNLNFNQCNNFRNFPRPIFTCYRNLISLLNQSETTIINPTIETANFIGGIVPQTVIASGNVVPSTSFNQGSAINYDNAGTFTLINGRYLISYNLSGIISANGTSSYSIYLNGNSIPSSFASSSGTVGDASTLSNSVFVEITSPTGAITIKNENTQPQTLNSGSVTIQKII